MKKWFGACIWIVAITGVSGCGAVRSIAGTNYEKIAADNRSNLGKLRLGMSVVEVRAVMVAPTFMAEVNNPYRTESIADKDGQISTILYYYTDPRQTRWRGVRSEELTPLVFRDDKLIGWGRAFIDQGVQKVEMRHQ